MSRSRPTVWLQNGTRVLLCVFFLLAAAYFAETTLCAIANFGWRQPMFDQWREYETLLGLSFPQNVIQEVNGHRPVIPNLIRLAEIRWFGASQGLQLFLGTLAGLLIAAIVAIAALRERQLSPVARCAAVMLAVLGVFWLANARRLLHGNEAVMGYLPILAVAVASYAVFVSGTRNSIACLWLACALCILATFCFGLGIASFVAVLLLCICLRVPHRWLGLPIGALALALTLYVFLLPGDRAVRGSLHLDVPQTAWQTMRWLSAPWMNGWLNSGDPHAAPVADPNTAFGRFVNESASLLANTLGSVGLGLEPLSALLGFIGVAAFCVIVLLTWRGKIERTPLNALAIGLGSFAIVSAVIVVAGRLEFLQQYPGQIFADRYLAWPTVFWSSLVILLVAQIDRTSGNIMRVSGLAFLIAMPIMLYATQWTGAIWGSIVYRIGQQTASQLRAGIYDHAHFPGLDEPASEQLREIALLKSRHLAMFADDTWLRIGTPWTGSLETDTSVNADARWLDPIADSASGKRAGHLEGSFMRGIAKARRFGHVALIDQNGIVVGLAEYSFLGGGVPPLLMRPRVQRGFDAYVKDYRDDEKYTLAILDFDSNRGIELMTLGPAIQSVPGSAAFAESSAATETR